MPMKNLYKTPKLSDIYPSLVYGASMSDSGVILGLNAFGHDSAAAIIDSQTGQVVFAVAEERLSNQKHDWHYPIGAIYECCQQAIRLGMRLRGVAVNFLYEEFTTKTLFQEINRLAGSALGVDELKSQLLSHLPNAVYFSLKEENPTSRFVSNLLNQCSVSEEVKATLALRISWYYNWSIKYRLIEETIREQFHGIPIHFVNHHLAHAASAYYNCGFENATILVIDGSGESDTVTVYRGESNRLELVSRTGWPHSLGIFYLFATQHLGFGLGDEYKVMGMSAYGTPRYFDLLQDAISVSKDARLVLHATDYQDLKGMSGIGHFAFQFSDRLKDLLPVRRKEDPFHQAHFDFAASIQKLTEEAGVSLVKQAVRLTGFDQVAIAGGVGLNGLMNEAIRTTSGCSDLFVYPAAGDDGCAVGAAQWLAAKTKQLPNVRLKSCYFGHDVTDESQESILKDRGIQFSRPESIHSQIAMALSDGKIVARCNGRAEFGPRALGNRSILAHPGLKDMKETLNLRVKHREQFRPFAPACLQEKVSKYFNMEHESPFMLLICKAKQLAHEQIPSVVHEDGTARVQSVSRVSNPDFYQLICEFEKRTGLPVVLNTSFNVNGETIVDTVQDAVDSFGFMDIDFLAIGPYWVSKSENLERFPSMSHEDYLEIRRTRYNDRHLGSYSEIDISKFDSAFLDVERYANEFVRKLHTNEPEFASGSIASCTIQ